MGERPSITAETLAADERQSGVQAASGGWQTVGARPEDEALNTEARA